MALLVQDLAGDFSTANIIIFGDGSSTIVSVDMEKAPCFSSNGTPFDFKGNYPIQVGVSAITVIGSGGSVDASFSATASIDKSKLTINFNKAPLAASFPAPVGGLTEQGMAELTLNFLYSGE